MEFYDLEPWGWEADCYKAGIIAATIANVHRDTKRKRDPFDAADFIPGGRSRSEKKTDGKLLKAQLLAAFAPVKDKMSGRKSDHKPPRVRRARGGS